MAILCGPAVRASAVFLGIRSELRVAEDLAATVRMLDDDPAETLVVIGPEIPMDEALRFTAGLRLTRPAVGVILVRQRVDVDVLTWALQSGVRDVVPAGDDAALAAACRRSREVSRRMSAPPGLEDGEPVRDGQIVTVFAAKGGCGKTTLAINLAVALARYTSHRVCIVDLDLAFGDVAISVQLDPARTMVDALPMAGHLDTAGAASLLTRYAGGWRCCWPRSPPVTRNGCRPRWWASCWRCCGACSTSSWWTRLPSSASTCLRRWTRPPITSCSPPRTCPR